MTKTNQSNSLNVVKSFAYDREAYSINAAAVLGLMLKLDPMVCNLCATPLSR